MGAAEWFEMHWQRGSGAARGENREALERAFAAGIRVALNYAVMQAVSGDGMENAVDAAMEEYEARLFSLRLSEEPLKNIPPDVDVPDRKRPAWWQRIGVFRRK